MNFCERSYQPILRYLYTEVTKRRGETSLHKHFKSVSGRVRIARFGLMMTSLLQVVNGFDAKIVMTFYP